MAGPQKVAAGPASNSSTVRRNLFNSNLIRRPTSQSSADTVQLSIPEDRPAPRPVDNDFLVRDSEGNILADPPIPLPEQDEDSCDNPDEREDAAAYSDALRLVDLYKTQRDQHIDPSDIRAALHAILRAKVADLAKDKWMYERDDEGDGAEKA